MTRILFAVAALAAVAASLFADPPAPYKPDLPPGAVEYKSEKYTQSLSKNSTTGFAGPFVPRIERKLIAHLPDRAWHQSGGMAGVPLAVSRKFRTLPEGQSVTYKLALVGVVNSVGHTQQEWGLTRSYPDGTRFDDVLSYGRYVFEHRVRTKVDGRWKSAVVFSDKARRPTGYTGLKQSCASCHDRAGDGLGYAAGNVPGGDGVFSDPVQWSAARVPWLRLD